MKKSLWLSYLGAGLITVLISCTLVLTVALKTHAAVPEGDCDTDARFYDVYQWYDAAGNEISSIDVHVGETVKISFLSPDDSISTDEFDYRIERGSTASNRVSGYELSEAEVYSADISKTFQLCVKGLSTSDEYLRVSAYRNYSGEWKLLACIPLRILPAEVGAQYPQVEKATIYSSKDDLVKSIRRFMGERVSPDEGKFFFLTPSLFQQLEADNDIIERVYAVGTDQMECENDEGDYMLIEGRESIQFHSDSFSLLKDYGWTVGAPEVSYQRQLYYVCTLRLALFETSKEMEEQFSRDIYNLCHYGELSNYANADAYTKIKACMDWVEDHVTYSTKGNTNKYYLTALSAYYEGEADCRGYALLLYRLLREMGIPNRVVQTGFHIWNLVYIDGLYYSCDASAESNVLLKGSSSFDVSGINIDLMFPMMNTDEFRANIYNKIAVNDYQQGTQNFPGTGLFPNNGDYYYYVNGVVNTGYTGLVYDANVGWWYVENGKINFNYNGLIEYNGTWWCVAGGQVRFDYTGLWCDPYVGWWYVTNGALDRNYTGMACNEYGWWYVTNGALDWNYTGMACNEYGWWYMTNGALDWNYTGMALNEYGWWYITNGALDWNYTGMACNEYGWWYMTNGALDWNYTGMACNDYGWWYMTNGALDWNYTGMACNDYGWWYMTNGALDWNYTGMALNEYGWWYITNGALDWDYTGLTPNEYGWWYYENGRINFSFNGLVPYGDCWWCVAGGAIDFDYTGLWYDANVGWWYVENGAINFGYTGPVGYDGATYNVVSGMVVF